MKVLEGLKSFFNQERLVADLIFDLEKKIVKMSSKHLKADLWLYKKCFSLLMSSIRLSRTALENNPDKNSYFKKPLCD